MVKENKITLYFMRHGESILNRAGRTQGWCDGVLTKEGKDLVIDAGLGLSNINFKAAYSSDLGRAVKTAEIVLEENVASKDIKLIKSEALREVYFGKYEGGIDAEFYADLLRYMKVRTFQEAAEKYNIQEAFCNACAALDETNEAENYETALNRFTKEIDKICAKESKTGSGNVLITTHGGILRLFLDYYAKENLEPTLLDNASITVVEYFNGRYEIKKINDKSHIEQGKTIRTI